MPSSKEKVAGLLKESAFNQSSRDAAVASSIAPAGCFCPARGGSLRLKTHTPGTSCEGWGFLFQAGFPTDCVEPDFQAPSLSLGVFLSVVNQGDWRYSDGAEDGATTASSAHDDTGGTLEGDRTWDRKTDYNVG
jgi:hypothetical protein